MRYSDNRKVKAFAKQLIETYGYTFQVPSRVIAKELKTVSFITAISYLKVLEKDGYLNRDMTSRKHGVKYWFDRYKISKLLGE